MKINKLKLFNLTLIISSYICFPSLAGGNTDSAEGSGLIAGGALSVVASPVLIPSGLIMLSTEGKNEGVTPGAISLAVGLNGPLLMSSGISKLISLLGEGLSNLTDDSVNSVNYSNIPTNIPKAVIDVKGQKKEIPFVVRPNFVQMNEEVKQ